MKRLLLIWALQGRRARAWPGGVAAPLAAWARGSLPRKCPWDVHLTPDASLPVPQAPLFEASHIRRWPLHLLRRASREGSAATGVANLRAHPKAEPADVGYFRASCWRCRRSRAGDALPHRGIVHRGQGYALRRLRQWQDHRGALLRARRGVERRPRALWPPAGWQMYATPFGKRRGDARRAVARVAAPDQGAGRVVPLSAGRRSVNWVQHAGALRRSLWLPEVMARWEALLSAVPVYALHFGATRHLGVIDAELG